MIIIPTVQTGDNKKCAVSVAFIDDANRRNNVLNQKTNLYQGFLFAKKKVARASNVAIQSLTHHLTAQSAHS